MYSADDIIEMRANGHRAMWITVAFFLVAVPVAFAAVLYLTSPMNQPLEIGDFLSIETAFYGAVWICAFGSSLVKAYQKKPYVAASGGDGALGHGDSIGD